MNCKTTPPSVSLKSLCSVYFSRVQAELQPGVSLTCCRCMYQPSCPDLWVGWWCGGVFARLILQALPGYFRANSALSSLLVPVWWVCRGSSSCCLRAPTHLLSFALLQNDEGSTHEKLDFKLHFSCASYLITTPCYRWVLCCPWQVSSACSWGLGQCLQGVTVHMCPVTCFRWLCRGSSVPCRLAEAALAARGHKLLQGTLESGFHICCITHFPRAW